MPGPFPLCRAAIGAIYAADRIDFIRPEGGGSISALQPYNQKLWEAPDVGEIVNVSADESVLDEDGKIDPDKLRPITFDPIHNAYRVLGEKVGNAFKDGAKLK